MGREAGRLPAGLPDTAPLCQPYSWGHASHYLFSWKWEKANSRSGEGRGYRCSFGGHATQQWAVPGNVSEVKAEPWSICLWRNPTQDRLCKEESPFHSPFPLCTLCSEGGEEWEKEATRGLRRLVASTFDLGLSICLLLMQLCGEAAFSKSQS